MNLRAAALLMLLASLVLIGATVSDWAVIDVTQTFEADGGAGQADIAVIEQTEAVNGAQAAGGLLAVGLAGMVLAGLQARYRRAAVAGPVLAAVGTVMLVEGWPQEGVVGTGPFLAGAALAAFLGLSLAVLTRPQPVDDTLPDPQPSRFTVEAARGDADVPVEQMDEWELAVADEDDVDMTRQDDR